MASPAKGASTTKWVVCTCESSGCKDKTFINEHGASHWQPDWTSHCTLDTLWSLDKGPSYPAQLWSMWMPDHGGCMLTRICRTNKVMILQNQQRTNLNRIGIEILRLSSQRILPLVGQWKAVRNLISSALITLILLLRYILHTSHPCATYLCTCELVTPCLQPKSRVNFPGPEVSRQACDSHSYPWFASSKSIVNSK